MKSVLLCIARQHRTSVRYVARLQHDYREGCIVYAYVENIYSRLASNFLAVAETGAALQHLRRYAVGIECALWA